MQDKKHCNSNSIFVPIAYLDMLQNMFAQYDASDTPNKEFLGEIECKFSHGSLAGSNYTQDRLLVTVNYWVFPKYLFKYLNDLEKFAQFFLDMELPCIDDECAIMSSATSLDGTDTPMDFVWFNNALFACNDAARDDYDEYDADYIPEYDDESSENTMIDHSGYGDIFTEYLIHNLNS